MSEDTRVGPWLALGRSNYRAYFLGQSVSQTGRWMQTAALAWLALETTGSAVTLGAIVAVQFTPILALSLFAGSLSDRLPRRRFLAALQGFAVLESAWLALVVLGGRTETWQLYLFALLQGAFNAIDYPTQQAFLGELVAPKEIRSAVGLAASTLNGARVLGPVLAGFVITSLGIGWCFALSASTYLVSGASFLIMRDDRLMSAAVVSADRLLSRVAAGLRYVRGDPELLVPIMLLSVIGTVGYNWQIVLPLLARYVFQTDAAGFGILNAAMGVGALVGGLFVAWRNPASALELCWVAIAFSIALIGLAFAPAFAVGLVALLAAGYLSVSFSSGVNATLQLRSKPEFRGRVLSLFFLAWAGGVPVGGALSGGIAQIFDVRVALATSAVICLTGSLVSAGVLGRHAAQRARSTDCL